MSITIGSPAAMTRSPGSWCGDALLGPEATIQNSAWSWPSATSRSRTSRATSASVRPTSGPAAIDATTRSAAWAAARSSATSSASLRIRRVRRTADASENRAPGRTRWSPSTKAARTPSETATARTSATGASQRRLQRGRDQRHRVLGLLPGGDLHRARRRGRARPRGGCLQARRDEGQGAPRGRDDEHRQALQRHRLVAREVPQVRPDADEQRVQPGRRRLAPCGRQPLRVPPRRDDPSRRSRSLRAGRRSATSPPIQAPNSRSPCSNSVR